MLNTDNYNSKTLTVNFKEDVAIEEYSLGSQRTKTALGGRTNPHGPPAHTRLSLISGPILLFNNACRHFLTFVTSILDIDNLTCPFGPCNIVTPSANQTPYSLPSLHTYHHLLELPKNACRYPHGLLQIRPREHNGATATTQARLDSTHCAHPLAIQAYLRLAARARHLRAAVRQHDDFRRRHGHAAAHANAGQRPRRRQYDCLGGHLGLDWWSHWPSNHGIPQRPVRPQVHAAIELYRYDYHCGAHWVRGDGRAAIRLARSQRCCFWGGRDAGQRRAE
jgi:hypothetical protein